MLCTLHALKEYVAVAALHQVKPQLEIWDYSQFYIQLACLFLLNLYLIPELDSFEHSFISSALLQPVWGKAFASDACLQDCVPDGSLPAMLIGYANEQNAHCSIDESHWTSCHANMKNYEEHGRLLLYMPAGNFVLNTLNFLQPLFRVKDCFLRMITAAQKGQLLRKLVQ